MTESKSSWGGVPYTTQVFEGDIKACGIWLAGHGHVPLGKHLWGATLLTSNTEEGNFVAKVEYSNEPRPEGYWG